MLTKQEFPLFENTFLFLFEKLHLAVCHVNLDCAEAARFSPLDISNKTVVHHLFRHDYRTTSSGSSIWRIATLIKNVS